MDGTVLQLFPSTFSPLPPLGDENIFLSQYETATYFTGIKCQSAVITIKILPLAPRM